MRKRKKKRKADIENYFQQDLENLTLTTDTS